MYIIKLMCFLGYWPILSFAQPPVSMYQVLINGDIIRYVYSGGDEFSGSQLDTEKWITEYPWGRNLFGNKEQQYYAPGNSNVQLDNGILKLITKSEPGYRNLVDWLPGTAVLGDGVSNYRYFPYTSGMLYSKQKFKYGLFEIRFKTSYNSKGLWPAFWLYSGVCKAEIDIFEMKGETPNKTHYGIVCDNNCDGVGNDCGGQWVTATGDFPAAFNIMRGEWTPNYIAWSLNNQEYATRFQTYTDPMAIITNVAVAGDNGAFPPGPDGSTILPSTFEVDYIRVWTRVDCNLNVVKANYTQTASDATVLTGKSVSMGSASPGGNAIVANEQYLTLVGTDYVKLLPGFQSRMGSHFWAKVAPCPGPPEGMVVENSELMGTLLPDNMNADKDDVRKDNETEKSVSVDTQVADRKENETMFYVRIYPNPSQEDIVVEFDGTINRPVKLELWDMAGRVVFTREIGEAASVRIDVSPYSQGVYYVKCRIGDTYFTEKVIINK